MDIKKKYELAQRKITDLEKMIEDNTFDLYNEKRRLTDIVVNHFVDLQRGNCEITYDSILEEKDIELQEMLTGILFLHEELSFRQENLNKIEAINISQIEELKQRNIEKDQLNLANLSMMEDLEIQSHALNNSLQEKEVLLQEIHHRVKNNFQIIISLLVMQMKKVSNTKVQEVLRKSEKRIMAMALVHEMLYRSDNLSKIKFKPYVKQLCGILVLDDTSKKINVNLEIEELLFEIDTAIPLGLIMNELITNSIKYAFPNKSAPQITIELKQNDDRNFDLHYFDNGIGYPENLETSKSQTLGFKLIQALSSQLNGQLKITSNNGAHVRIKFEV